MSKRWALMTTRLLPVFVATTSIDTSGKQLSEKRLWEAAIRETLMCEREPTNDNDRCAVVGHLPKISGVCSLFLRRGGSIQCTVQ